MSTEEREISTTKRWGIGLLTGMLVQTAGIAWWAAMTTAQGEQNEARIDTLESKLESTINVNISRQQLDDILGLRDSQIKNLEDTMKRIESKLDRLAE